MAECIPFSGQTGTARGSGCVDMPIHAGADGEGRVYVTSCWKFTKPELEEIYHKGCVYVTLISVPGAGINPQIVQSRKPDWIEVQQEKGHGE